MRIIKIDGEIYRVKQINEGSDLTHIDTEEGPSFYLASDSESAGKAARQHYEDMANDDPEEFRCIVGDESLIQWALGQYAGPGNEQVKSLTAWLDLWLTNPEECWATYDGDEKTAKCGSRLSDELGFEPTVAYRHN